MPAEAVSPDAREMVVCRQVEKWFDDFHVLRGITTTVREGEVVVIIGPSGSGKSTFIRCLNRLEEHQKGDIIVDDIELSHDIRNIEAGRREVGMVFQQFNLFPHKSVLENVTLAQQVVRRRKVEASETKARALLKKVGIAEKEAEYPSRLSGGQQQRLCLARGLAVEPEVLLCDEATSALDPISAQRIEGRLLELKADYSIVLVTHVLRQARRLADYVVFMYMGELVEHGPADEVFHNPREARTRAYLEGEFY